jgi:hypothetical protein
MKGIEITQRDHFLKVITSTGSIRKNYLIPGRDIGNEEKEITVHHY